MIVIRPFAAADQNEARALILGGLGEHFGHIDETLNPDLDDIDRHYVLSGASFIVAEIDGVLAGTGALIPESAHTGRLVRMSVSPLFRGKGLGKALVYHLLEVAREQDYRRVVCETNHDWADAIGLYLACGFREIGIRDGDRHFVLDLAVGSA